MYDEYKLAWADIEVWTNQRRRGADIGNACWRRGSFRRPISVQLILSGLGQLRGPLEIEAPVSN
jgi:hypothetical protein